MIAYLSGDPYADTGLFLCLADPDHLTHVLELPINTDIPPVGTPILVATPRAAVLQERGLETQMLVLQTEVTALHKRYPNINGPCFEFAGGVDHQASGAPVIFAHNSDYVNHACACGIVSLSNFDGGHPLRPPPGTNWFSLAALLFPMMGFETTWLPASGQPETRDIADFVNRGIIKNFGTGRLEVYKVKGAADGPRRSRVVSPQWNSLNLPEP